MIADEAMSLLLVARENVPTFCITFDGVTDLHRWRVVGVLSGITWVMEFLFGSQKIDLFETQMWVSFQRNFLAILCCFRRCD